jgi:hypothetical protein
MANTKINSYLTLYIKNTDLFVVFFFYYLYMWGARGGVVIKALRYKPAGRGFDFRWCHRNFFSDTILPVALSTWGRLSLWQKWVPRVFPGGKAGRCLRLTTLPPSCAVFMKSGNLNFLEPSGPFQACNGTALPILIYENVVGRSEELW